MEGSIGGGQSKTSNRVSRPSTEKAPHTDDLYPEVSELEDTTQRQVWSTLLTVFGTKHLFIWPLLSSE